MTWAKSKALFSALLGFATASLSAQDTHSSLNEAPWAVSKRTAHENRWESVSLTTNIVNGEPVVKARKHSYLEIASFLNFFDEQTEAFQPTIEQWEAFEDGLVARFGPHKVIIDNNLTVDFMGVGGTRLMGSAVALGIFDPVDEKHAILATVIPSEPVWGNEERSQIIFPQSFDNIGASIRYTYRKYGFSQEFILEEPFELPEGFSAASRIEIYSAFDPETPAPMKTAQVLREETGFTDEALRWPDFEMTRGKAFALSSGANVAGIPVAKTWQRLEDDWWVLIEAVEWSDLQPLLAQLQAGHAPKQKTKALAVTKGRGQLVPAGKKDPHFVGTSRPHPDAPKELALTKYKAPAQSVVIDYEILNSLNTNAYTFKGDSTYFLSGQFYVTNAILEGVALSK